MRRSTSKDGWVKELLVEDEIVVHPGYFFGMAEEGYLVVSLLTEPAVFAEAASGLALRLGEG
jgi:alanine-synthesizing transaminase